MSSSYKVLYYYVNWGIYAREYPVKKIPDKVEDIVYAFANVIKEQGGYYHLPVLSDPYADHEKRFTSEKDGVLPLDKWYYGEGVPEESFYGNFNQIRKVQEQRRKNGGRLNCRLSLGGWTFSKYFSSAVRTAESRAAFAEKIIYLFEKYPIFSGVDIDWEYISPPNENYGKDGNQVHPDDPANFIALLKEIKRRFSEKNWDYSISCALTAAPEKAAVLPIEEMVKLDVNFLLMTYDYDSSAWGDTVANHHTNLFPADYTVYSTDAAVKYYRSRGVPAKKIFIGVAFYSRGFANTDGLGKSSNGVVKDYTWEKGVVDYKQLPLPGSTEKYDEKCEAAYCYDPKKRDLHSYDNPRSVKAKCDYVKKNGLGGILVWELSADHPVDHERSLVRVLHDNLLKDQQAPPLPSPPSTPPLPPQPPKEPNVPEEPEEPEQPEEPNVPEEPEEPEIPEVPEQLPKHPDPVPPPPPHVDGKVKRVTYTAKVEGNAVAGVWEYEYYDT